MSSVDFKSLFIVDPLDEIAKNLDLKKIEELIVQVMSDLKNESQESHPTGLRLKKSRELKKATQLIIKLLGDEEMKALNSQFRSKDSVTDILSFESIEDEDLGELVICSSVLAEQAKQNDIPIAEEFLYLTLHGMLHLVGFEHEYDKVEEAMMFEIQDRLFDKYRDLC